MKQMKLGRVADGFKFKLNRYSKVWYKKIIRYKTTTAFTSLNSERSFFRPNSTKVWYNATK